MSHQLPPSRASGDHPKTSLLSRWNRTPLYLRILIALALGVAAGLLLHGRAGSLKPFSDIVLQLLRLLATPLIFIAVIHALVKANVTGRMAGRLVWLLLSNTVVAILIGLLVANTVRPGHWVSLRAHPEAVNQKPFDPLRDLLEKIPGNLVDPFRLNEIISIIILAVAFGVALRIVRGQEGASAGVGVVEGLLDTAYRCVLVMLHWLFNVVPLAVFAVVARVVGTQGITAFAPLAAFVIAVLLALALQAAFYLTRLRLGSWVRPGPFLRGSSDALTMAFSTASSVATLPVTYASVKDQIGVREESAGMGVMVGGTFNHDGTALYEAMSALFISQLLGMPLGLGHQLLVVLMSITASVGAAGIPEAGLVTMMAVFTAVHLPVEYIPFLLPLDWFLDRCRTAINVMGDMTVTCILDGRRKEMPPRSHGDTERRPGGAAAR